jgi:tetraacyldisaccharide 4'-kinase
MHLAQGILRAGGRPLYLSRGYGSAAGAAGTVTWVPGARETGALPPGVRRVRRAAPRLAARVGDEGAMFVRRLPDVPAVFAADKRRALERARAAFEPTHVLLDDAFQSWGVPRHLDVVLVDAERPFSNGRLLPAGPLREPPEALARADLIGVNGARDDSSLERAGGEIARRTGVRGPLFGVRRALRYVTPARDPAAPPRGACAVVSGIARPARLETAVAGSGVEVSAALRYPDHHPYTRRDLETIVREADARGIETVLTTEKDWVKLADLDPPTGRFVVAVLDLELFGADPFAVIKRAADLVRGS